MKNYEEKIFFNIPEIKKIGIYYILNTENHFIYIGSSVNVYERMKAQARAIKNGGPNNAIFQDMIKYGLKVFSFGVLKVFEDNTITDLQLRQYEQYYINKARAENRCYNKNDTWSTGKYEDNSLLVCPIEKENNIQRFSIVLPKKITKEYIKELSGESVNGLINRLVADEIERLEKLKLSNDELPFK